ncbi:amidohydrolase [Sphingomicrobium lutaoense]|uniref:Amidohydrolase 3 domain-containing protein n=1 Tax=Sphingomicrobium lutaoense TaxID=515949 RepID=A0A839YZ91_9SPHN|nr:amidohydrolase [Sphingomicrobium lutaoense]MBB3764306.1 hypothetical protein [Sphingomicrobium lutaoense]
MRTLLATVALVALAAPASADTLYDNVNGLRADEEGRIERFDALLVSDDGKVVQLVAQGVERPEADFVLDMEGRTMMPGLIDAHGHVIGLGLATMQLDLTGTASIAELKQRVADYAAANPDLPWITGRGWNQELFADGRMPRASDLDAVVPDRPVWLGRVDGHAAIANSAAMKAAGVTAASTVPEGGEMVMGEDGQPTGLFIDTAEQLVAKAVPQNDAATLDLALAAAQQFALSHGLTAVADMGTAVGDWHAMRRAGDRGSLKLRIMSYSGGLEPALTIAGTGPTPWLYDGKLRMGGIKLYSDGALGSRGALLKQPYEDAPASSGLPVTPMPLLEQQAITGASRGFQMAIHAIGDAANDTVIGIFERLGGGDNARHRIEHVQILDPADLPRIARAGIIASMQPVHQSSDWQMAEKRLGPDRLGAAYAWKSILDSGARLAFGSDFPVEHPNPFVGLKVAISREDAKGQPQGGWLANEKLSFGQALAAFTTGAAHAGFAEKKFGSLEAGQYADFIIVDRDPTAVDADALAETQVLQSWVGGRKVYSRD